MSSIQHEVMNLFCCPPDDMPGAPKTVSVRLSPGRLAWVDALAEHAELSRNAMCNELIRFGISTVLAQLPDEIRADIDNSLADRLVELGINGEI